MLSFELGSLRRGGNEAGHGSLRPNSVMWGASLWLGFAIAEIDGNISWIDGRSLLISVIQSRIDLS